MRVLSSLSVSYIRLHSFGCCTFQFHPNLNTLQVAFTKTGVVPLELLVGLFWSFLTAVVARHCGYLDPRPFPALATQHLLSPLVVSIIIAHYPWRLHWWLLRRATSVAVGSSISARLAPMSVALVPVVTGLSLSRETHNTPPPPRSFELTISFRRSILPRFEMVPRLELVVYRRAATGGGVLANARFLSNSSDTTVLVGVWRYCRRAYDPDVE